MAAEAEEKTKTHFELTRQRTEALCKPLSVEDLCVQSMPDASPAKWHLAHTSWFFDRFLLENGRFDRLFNSYYDAVGKDRLERGRRGTISRPSADEVFEYRNVVTEAVLQCVRRLDPQKLRIVELGIYHEEQHQELLLTDIQHAFFLNPMQPAYGDLPNWLEIASVKRTQEVVEITQGVHEVGAEGEGFAFDNERGRHRVYLEATRVQLSPVTAREYLEFVEDQGYSSPLLWLSEGWAKCVVEQGWRAPLYWRKYEGAWQEYTLTGWIPLRLDAPVMHVSFYEADAFTRWKGKEFRLPTEFEWEVAKRHSQSRWSDSGVWEWTSSAYRPYPGFRPFEDGFAEYNGKFMMNQMVLRGGSWATPHSSRRDTYRNFFPPDARWQYSGFRLAA